MSQEGGWGGGGLVGRGQEVGGEGGRGSRQPRGRSLPNDETT